MCAVYEVMASAAATDATVLILGESGTGKELVARAIHANGARADGPFVKVDCTAIPETLIEAELFGHEKGAFTGADRMVKGKCELAAGGTLFLDEIGDMPLALQAKLLRFVQDRELERIGGRQVIKADVRVVAATHRDLEDAVRRGTFRKDLFYRIKVVQHRAAAAARARRRRHRAAGAPLPARCTRAATAGRRARSTPAAMVAPAQRTPGRATSASSSTASRARWSCAAARR